jgi:hypothetical protein
MGNEPRASKGRTDPTSRGVRLLLAGWAAVQALERRTLDRKSFASYCGVGETAFSNWTVGATELAQVEAVLRLFERIPHDARACLLDGLLRVYPTLDAPALAHDPLAVDRLRRLSQRDCGLTLIQGRDFSRSFVLATLGHLACRLGSSIRPIAGLDVHSEAAIVPVPGVTYLDYPRTVADFRERVRAHWPPNGGRKVLLLNGILSSLPELQNQIFAASEKRHVILADETTFDPSSIRQSMGDSKTPTTLLSVSDLSNDRVGIQFSDA